MADGSVKPMKLSLSTKKAYILTAFTFGIGVYASYSTRDWSWLARAGSAIVVVGIILTSSQIINHNRYLRQRWMDREFFKRGRNQFGSDFSRQMSRDFAADDRFQSLVHERSREEEAWEIEGHGLYILITGTLVWGFGDLIGFINFP